MFDILLPRGLVHLLTHPERRQALTPTDIGGYSPGIRRIIARAQQDLLVHDQSFKGRGTGWQVDYSLALHSVRVGMITTTITERLTHDPVLKRLAAFAAFLHDMGKLKRPYHMYRLAKKFNTVEHEYVGGHAYYSGRYEQSGKRLVREEDYDFLDRALLPIVHHHEPWLIEDERLRTVGVEICVADTFGSLMEERYRPGLSQFEALVALEQIVEKWSLDPHFNGNVHLLEATYHAIKQSYSAENALNDATLHMLK